jgi:hypothetical protein
MSTGAGNGDAQVAGGGGGVKVLLFLFLVACAAVAYLELTQHLDGVRAGGIETRMDTWKRLEWQVRNRRDNDGFKYYAASCMFSTIRSEGSVRFGEPNPHFKLAACKSGVCDYAIVGVMYDEPAIVTARGGVPEKVYLTEVRKDACMNFDVGRLLGIIDGNILP